MAVDPTQDADFMKAAPHDQMAYLAATDPDFAKAAPQDQMGYLMHIRGLSPNISGPAAPVMGQALNPQQVPIGGMTPDQDDAAAMRSIQHAAGVAKGAAQGAYDISTPGIFQSIMQKVNPAMAANIPLPQAGDVKDIPEKATLTIASSLEEEGLPNATQPSIKPAPEVAPSSSGVSLGSIVARHIPVVGRYLRTIDDIQALLGKDAPHPTASANVAAPKAPVPETNGIQWGTGGQGPLDLRGKMIPNPQPPYEVQSIPVQGMKAPSAQGIPNLPEMQPAQSTTIAQHGYDPTSQRMFVQFKNGNIYRYSGVPQKVYDQYVASESQGSFHAQQLKGRYQTDLVGKVKPTPGQQVTQALRGNR